MFGSFFKKAKPDQHFEMDLPNADEKVHSEIAPRKNPDPKDAADFIPSPKPPLLSAENIALISLILMLLVAGLGVRSCMKLSDLEKTRLSESQGHEVMLDSLLRVKADLETQLDSLAGDFSSLSTENDALAQRLATSTNVIAEKETVIREIKSRNTREEKELRAQVQRLQTIKDRYETIISVLTQKNNALIAENATLRGSADSLSMQVSELGKKLEAQVRRTLSAQFKATAFRVEMVRRKDKLTVRARRTRELNISFELNNVHSQFQGNQQLFLVITDDQGVPIASDNPTQATIKTEKGDVPIIAQATRFQNVIDNQRIAMAYKLEDRLKKGTYVVSVYSDKGLLGVATFRLT